MWNFFCFDAWSSFKLFSRQVKVGLVLINKWRAQRVSKEKFALSAFSSIKIESINHRPNESIWGWCNRTRLNSILMRESFGSCFVPFKIKYISICEDGWRMEKHEKSWSLWCVKRREFSVNLFVFIREQIWCHSTYNCHGMTTASSWMCNNVAHLYTCHLTAALALKWNVSYSCRSLFRL